MFMFPL